MGDSGDFSMCVDGFARATAILASRWQGDNAVASSSADTVAAVEQ
jgi:hypothetical protein